MYLQAIKWCDSQKCDFQHSKFFNMCVFFYKLTTWYFICIIYLYICI